MGKEHDIEDEKFEALLQDKRHRELSTALRSIATSLSNKDDKGLANAINGQVDKISALVVAIQNIPKPEKPADNTDTNTQGLVLSINKMCEDILASNNKVIEALSTRLLPDTFTLIKGYGDITQSVKVDYKEANKIIVKK